MKHGVIKTLVISSALFVGAMPSAWAVLSDQVVIPSGSRVVIMVGTFSPLHNRHIEQMQAILNSGQADFVLVIPNDMTVHKPFAVPTEIRLEGLQSVFADHPRVIVPHSVSELGFPIASKVRKYLNQKFKNLQWGGAIGKDSALSFWAPVGAHLQSMQHWLVLTPDANDESEIPKTFGRKPAMRIYSPTDNDVRSTQIRKAIESKDFETLAQLLPDSVINWAFKHELYQKPDPKPTLRIYLSNCGTLIKKLLYR